jgi:BioD-like phosphotransacetylase family protein
MLERVGSGTLVIVPGDREDVIRTVIGAHGARDGAGVSSKGVGVDGTDADSTRGNGRGAYANRTGADGPGADVLPAEGPGLGLVLTGGYRPSRDVVDAIRQADLFATLVPRDTYRVASDVHDLLVKTHPADREKIRLIKQLVAENLDVERLLAVATPAG